MLTPRRHRAGRLLITISGIDVQAELQMKTGSPVLGPGFLHPAPTIPQQPQLQRTALQRQQARRSGTTNFLPKLAPGQTGTDVNFASSSPNAHPTPSSHASSPSQLSTRSPMALHQGGMTPPMSAVFAQTQAQQFQPFARSSQPHPNQGFYQATPQQPSSLQRQTQRPTPTKYQSSTSGMSSMSTSSHQSMAQSLSGVTGGSAVQQPASVYYPTPFQKHFDQLGKLTPIPFIELCSS